MLNRQGAVHCQAIGRRVDRAKGGMAGTQGPIEFGSLVELPTLAYRAPQSRRYGGELTDPYEELVRWYLRFNGFLTTENFVVHSPNRSLPRVPAGTETDILGVRFPHSKESPAETWTPDVEAVRFTIRNHSRLFDADAMSADLIDFLIAEVKGGNDRRLNATWRSPDPSGRLVQHVE